MKGKPLRILLWILLLPLVLVAVAAVVLPLVIDPNDFKPQIAAAVEERTGRTLEIDGDIALSVFPWLGLDIGPTSLSNAAGFTEPHMAQVKQAQVRVKLMPLLGKRLEVDKVRLAGLVLNLGTNSAGVTNWADLQGASEEPDTQAPDDGGTEAPARLESLSIGGITIDDSRLVWDDRAAGSRYEINALSLTTGRIEPGKPFDLDLEFELAGAVQDAVSALSLDGDVLLAPGLKAFEIAGAKLVVDARGEGVPAGRVNLSLSSDLAVDLEAGTLSMPAVVLKALGMNVTGNVEGTGISGDTPQFHGAFDVAALSPRVLIRSLGMDDPVTADSAVLDKANAKLKWSASTDHFSADDLQLQLDDTLVNGKAKIARFAAPEITFTLAADQLDLDRYLPPAASDEAASGKKPDASPAAKKESELPVDVLRGLNLNGKLAIASLKAFNLRSTDVDLNIRARNGQLSVTPATAQLYEGRMQNEITLDVRSATPRLSFDYDLDSIKAGELLRDLTGTDKLLGTTSFRSKITATGTTADAIKRSLNGNASFTFSDGTVKGVNIPALLRAAHAKYKGQPVPASTGPNQTNFSELSGTVVISDGVIRNSDLLLNSPLLRLTGKGKASLPEETIDYTVTARIADALAEEDASLAELQGVSVPVRISGTFSKPRYLPDVAAALREVAKARVEEKVTEKVEEKKQQIRDKIGDKLGDELQDKLKGIFR